MSKPLSPLQQAALAGLKDGERRSAFDLKAKLGTLESLATRGLVTAKRGLGSMAFPHTSIGWRITNEGLRVARSLEAQKLKENT